MPTTAATAHQHAPVIAQIIPQLETGGAEMTTVEVTDAITKAGGQALVLSEGGQLVSRIMAAGGTFHAFPAASKNPLVMAANVQRIRTLIRDHDIKLIHARSRAPAWSALAAARLARIPFVTTYHGVYRANNAIKRFYNSVMARGDVVIANSAFTRNAIETDYGLGGDRIVTVFRGVDRDATYNPDRVSSADIAALREKWRIENDRVVIIVPGRLSPIKGQETAIEAAHELARRGALGKLLFVFAGGNQGRDAYTDRLKARISEHGLDAHFLFIGHSDQLPVWFSMSRVALVTSKVPEGFGRVSIEAQAMGCPVIVSDLGALPETLFGRGTTAATGWTFTPGAAAELADAMQSALNLSDDDMAHLKVRARDHTAGFTSRQLQSETLAVYDRLLGTQLAKAFADV